MERLAVKLVDNRVVEVIVGEASWAEETLGGCWVQFVRDTPGKTYPAYNAVYDERSDDFINPEIVIYPEIVI